MANLLLSYQPDKSYKTFIVEYDLSPLEFHEISNEELSSTTVVLKEIDFSDISIILNSINKSTVVSCTTTWKYTPDEGQLVGDGNDDLAGWYVSSESCKIIYVREEESFDQGDSGSGGDGSTGGGGTSTGGGGTTTGDGDDSDNDNSSSDPNDENPENSECFMDSDGNCIGDLTSPTLEPPVSTSTKVINIMNLDTRSRHYSWLDNNASLSKAHNIYNFLLENAETSEAIEEAKLLIDIEIAQERGWDFTQTGTYLGRSTLKYKAKYNLSTVESMYLLENGLVLYVANGPKSINAETSFASSEATDGYHYIYSYDTKRYYEYRMPPTNYASNDLDFLFEGFWDGVKLFGRYATPLEEAIILIDGKDFDGVSQSKAVAGVLILVDVVPGGKIIRITRKTGLALDAVSPVFRRTTNAIYNSQKSIIESYRDVIANAIRSRKGNFAEMSVDVEWFQKGYEDLHVNKITSIDAGGHHGIDHIFKNPVTNEYSIVESKFHGTGGLNPENLTTNLPRQMSDEWIDNGLANSRLLTALGNNSNLYGQIRDNYVRVVAYVKSNGEINYKYVSSSGYEVSTYPTP